MRRETLQQRLACYCKTCASSPDSYISTTMSQPPTSSPSTNSWGIVGQLEIAESSWRIRGSGSTSTAAKGTSSACSAATVRAEKPHAGASGDPFMKRSTRCSEMASATASRIGLDSLAGAAEGAGSPLSMGRGSGWLADMEVSSISVGLDRRWDLGLQRQGVDGPSDLPAEDGVDESMLLDAAATLERRRGDGGAEVIAAAGVVLDLGVGTVDRRLDALLYVLGGGHRPSVEDRRSRSGGRDGRARQATGPFFPAPHLAILW